MLSMNNQTLWGICVSLMTSWGFKNSSYSLKETNYFVKILGFKTFQTLKIAS